MSESRIYTEQHRLEVRVKLRVGVGAPQLEYQPGGENTQMHVALHVRNSFLPIPHRRKVFGREHTLFLKFFFN